MIEENDWRLERAPAFVVNAQVSYQPYVRPSATWDHDHCVFCYQKIAEPPMADAVHSGYLFAGHAEWACAPCFDDLGAHFGMHPVHPEACPGTRR